MPSNSIVGFVMLNPSQADAVSNDPTLRRCSGFAKAWGFRDLKVVNLFAYRAKTPQLLKQAIRSGKGNDGYLSTLPERVDLIGLSWGNWSSS